MHASCIFKPNNFANIITYFNFNFKSWRPHHRIILFKAHIIQRWQGLNKGNSTMNVFFSVNNYYKIILIWLF